METLIKTKNIEIALMLGATMESWYPPNEATKSSGLYLSFPICLYTYIENGVEKQHKWYPDNKKYHGDSLLKFDSDANWQFETIEFIENHKDFEDFRIEPSQIILRASNQKSKLYSIINYSNNGRFFSNSGIISKKEAIFEALFKFSQYLKENKKI